MNRKESQYFHSVLFFFSLNESYCFVFFNCPIIFSLAPFLTCCDKMHNDDLCCENNVSGERGIGEGGVDLAEHPGGILSVSTDDCVGNGNYVYIFQYVRAFAGQHCTENSLLVLFGSFSCIERPVDLIFPL